MNIGEVLDEPPPAPNGDANGDGKRHNYQDEFVELFNPSTDTIAYVVKNLRR